MSDVTNVVKLSSLAQTDQVDAAGRFLYLGNDGVAYIVTPTDILIENETGDENKPKYKITVSNAERLGNLEASSYATKVDLTGGTLVPKKAITADSASTATRATQDGSGNTITSTYATKADLTGGTLVPKKADTLATARSIKISDNTSANTGTAVNFNGSADITLKLPGTIAASITGNAASATKATNDSNNKKISDTYLTKKDASNTYLGKTATAAKATSDANGNNIANTYQTKAKANVTAALKGTTLVLTIN